MRFLILVSLAASGLALGGCEGLSRTQQRALSGGAMGAAGGAVVTAVTGGSLLTGAVVGGAGGAVIGAVTGGHR